MDVMESLTHADIFRAHIDRTTSLKICMIISCGDMKILIPYNLTIGCEFIMVIRIIIMSDREIHALRVVAKNNVFVCDENKISKKYDSLQPYSRRHCTFIRLVILCKNVNGKKFLAFQLL